jgi:hypothetical protein
MKRAGAGEKTVLLTSLTKRCDPLPETLVGHDLENVSSGGSKEAKFLSIDRLSGVQIGMIGVVATAAQTDTDSFGRTTAKFVLTLRIRAASPRYQYSSDHSFWLVADEGGRSSPHRYPPSFFFGTASGLSMHLRRRSIPRVVPL